jgi:hypothetical protein
VHPLPASPVKGEVFWVLYRACSPLFVMPDSIPAKDGIFDRHPVPNIFMTLISLFTLDIQCFKLLIL